jgi:acylphosphatase
MDHPRCVRVLVSGRVQGVWYRGWTVEAAQARGLAGWVRNLADGRVEAVFCGPVHQVDAMLDACRQGPPAARVTTVEAEDWAEHPGAGFHQRPTV